MGANVVVDYDPGWVDAFEQVRELVWPALRGVASSIEHVGSTAVPGLAAKPIIDVTVVVPAPTDVPAAIERLASIGYVHRGTLGIAGREAFDGPPAVIAHHLYMCPQGTVALANHLAVRDRLRAHPDEAREYGALKRRLAEQFPHDRDAYVEGKTDFLLDLLRAAGLPDDSLAAIARANRGQRKR